MKNLLSLIIILFSSAFTFCQEYNQPPTGKTVAIQPTDTITPWLGFSSNEHKFIARIGQNKADLNLTATNRGGNALLFLVNNWGKNFAKLCRIFICKLHHKSSEKIIHPKPVFSYDYTDFSPEFPGQVCKGCVRVYYSIYYKNAKTSLTTNKGGIVGYSRVSVKDSSSSGKLNGKIDYYYDNAIEEWYPNNFELEYVSENNPYCDYHTGFLFVHPIIYNWKHGLLERKVISKYEDGTYIKVKEIENKYNIDLINSNTAYQPSYYIVGLKAGIRHRSIGKCFDPCIAQAKIITTNQYYYPIRISKLKSTEEIYFDQTGANEIFRTKKESTYRLNHLQVSSKNISEINKIDDKLVSYHWDYKNTYPVIKAINVNNNQLSSVIQDDYQHIRFYGFVKLNDLVNNST